MKIILGSKSKGRKKILTEMGYDFDIMDPDIDEKAIRFEDPRELTLALAKAKVEALLPQISEPAILITSDQIVVYQDKIREKPENAEEAREFLRSYNEEHAETVTAVAATNTKTGKSASEVEIAKIYFNPFSDKDIDEIIKLGDTFHYAGGFDVAGYWEKYVKKIEGNRDSVIGLPKELTKKLIEKVIK